MTLKDWQRQIVREAADQPDASYAALARWAKVHVDTLRKARKRDPEFDKAISDARSGKISTSDIVDIETFVRSKEFLGLGIRGKDEKGKIYPRVLEHLKEINSGDFSLAIMAGGIGSAKTVTSVISLVYQLYVLLSQDDPHEYLKLGPASPVLIVLQNRNERLAKANAYTVLRNYIEGSPWFAQNMPHDERLKSKLVFLKRSVEVWPIGGDAAGVLGMNVYASLQDESNFYDITAKSKRSVTEDRVFDQAREGFEGLIRRKLSRLDEDKGIIFVSSSRRYKGEFTSQLTDEFGSDSRTYLFDETAWSINPGAYAKGNWFNVFQGDQQRPARILGEDEEIDVADRPLVHKVPQKFHRQFASNCTRSLQDLAGVAVERQGSFFTNRQELAEAACLENVLMSKSDTVGDALDLVFQPHTIQMRHPLSPRAAHADLSLSGDSTGICIAHIASFDGEGRPRIEVDALGRVHPPRFGQIDLNSVYKLVLAWQQANVPISFFSCDGFQSAAVLQRVAKLGIHTGRLSVDQTSVSDPCGAYEALRISVAEGRVKFPADEKVVEELLALELDHKRMRIDHPPNGSKDSADALAGAVYRLTQIPAWQLVDKVTGSAYAAAVNNSRLGGVVTNIPGPRINLSEMDLIRAMRGMPARV